jgi:hypothetical protein
MMNKSCFDYTKIKHDCDKKLQDICPPERKQLLPDLFVGRNAAYISVFWDFCMD